MSFTRGTKEYNDRRPALRKIAEETLKAIDDGFVRNGITHDLRAKVEDSKKRTKYYAPDAVLSTWSTPPASTSTTPSTDKRTEFSVLEISTLEAARLLATTAVDNDKIGILNFASAKKPGGGFLNGAQAQEESIARSSTLYPTLMTSQAKHFYTLHNRDPKDGYYSHAMIYSPGVVVFRDNDGGWEEPIEVDVVTSPAVNAGVVRKSLMGKLAAKGTEEKIERVMKERMGRILFLLEQQGAKHIVLGSFGTGVFQNDVGVIARLWTELLSAPGARFEHSFTRVVFGVLGRQSFEDFRKAFKG
ncbi:putative uncharacterized protein conserved in bacteria (DUF2263) [Lyophyllum shimeji]|uniref:Microbial-type PARG catalytic domain-containing protein n=1 Tax=Lyophyllum shimeji TaxID=47721 RepID=A0A9P3UH90_LYOSH|nr:putative uncharacterized protein conserved in bacteria (DUF2263) [Lyophyllum shimeji]